MGMAVASQKNGIVMVRMIVLVVQMKKAVVCKFFIYVPILAIANT